MKNNTQEAMSWCKNSREVKEKAKKYVHERLQEMTCD